MILKTECRVNLLRIAWYDYMRMCEWFFRCLMWWYHGMMYFLLYLECEKSHVVIKLYNEVNVGVYIYVNWLCNCWWIHICWVMLNLLMIAYILCEWWWRGELFVWTYALLSSHMFMHSWLMVIDFISNWGDYDVQLESWGDNLNVVDDGTTCI